MKADFRYTLDTPKSFSRFERLRDGLQRDVDWLEKVQPDEHTCVVHLNSTYLDAIDCWDRDRGGINFSLILFLGVPVAIFMLLAIVYMIKVCLDTYYPQGAIALAITLCVVFPVTGYLFWKMFSAEFFKCTYYPIRFNRKTRMIHVFRHKSKGGVLSIPWDESFFSIGNGSYMGQELRDLRGYLMNGDKVMDSFAVGDTGTDPEQIKQFWKFIVIYMEQGPQALPRDNYINTSTNCNLYNQFIKAVIHCTMILPIPVLNWIFIPFVTIARWLIMKTCKAPAWPPEIAAESAIDTNDPYVWKEPAYSIRDFFRQDTEKHEKNVERVKRLRGRK